MADALVAAAADDGAVLAADETSQEQSLDEQEPSASAQENAQAGNGASAAIRRTSISELEEMFKNRYTTEEEAYAKLEEEGSRPPICIFPWPAANRGVGAPWNRGGGRGGRGGGDWSRRGGGGGYGRGGRHDSDYGRQRYGDDWRRSWWDNDRDGGSRPHNGRGSYRRERSPPGETSDRPRYLDR
ncbi:hypothetical protein AAVH_13693 [Aphelenchoides avenae]|nr:hypothetical protein AAVH_13693 [Aphelenchus avenae]